MKKTDQSTFLVSIFIVLLVLFNSFMVTKLDQNLMGEEKRYFIHTIFTDTGFYNEYYSGEFVDGDIYFERHVEQLEDVTYEGFSIVSDHFDKYWIVYEAKQENKLILILTGVVLVYNLLAAFSRKDGFKIEQLAFIVNAVGLGYSMTLKLPTVVLSVSLILTVAVYFILRKLRVNKEKTA